MFGRQLFVRLLIGILLFLPKFNFYANKVHEHENCRYKHSRVHQSQLSAQLQEKPASTYSKEAIEPTKEEPGKSRTQSGTMNPDVVQETPPY